MIRKTGHIPPSSEELYQLMERPRLIPGRMPSGRIEMVDTRLGRVAAGVFPNGSLNIVRMLVADEDLGLLTTHTTFTRFDGKPYTETPLRTSHALFGVAIKEAGGIEQWPLFRRQRRHEIADLKDTLTALANSGSSFDPFQNHAIAVHLMTAVEAQSDIHPAIHEAVTLT